MWDNPEASVVVLLVPDKAYKAREIRAFQIVNNKNK